jgi:deoxyadenosine/deoxycytidine kinase
MTTDDTRAPFVAVAGNIGTGKSGLVKRLASSLPAEPLLESIEKNSFFELFYREPSTWAFPSQMAFAIDALHRQVRALEIGSVVQDRTVYETVDVFSTVLRASGFLDDEEWALLSTVAEAALLLPRQPTLLLYLEAPTDVLFQRIRARNRRGEENVSRRYLDRLGEEYERFVTGWNLSPIVRVDTTEVDLRRASGQHLLDLLQGP